MQKKTIFAISFFLISLVVLFAYAHENPVPGGNKYHLPEPRDVDVNGVTFKISWGFLEDSNSSDASHDDTILNYSATVVERTFHQNDILLLSIKAYDFRGNDFTSDDLNRLNDGSFEDKTINGVEGIFKTEPVENYSGFVKNNHLRYYFDYVKDNKLVMIQCDKLDTLDKIVK